MGSVRIENEGPLRRVVLARPERRNAFDAGVIEELRAAFADPGDARAVLLSGEGKSFSAGADVAWMRSSAELDYDGNIRDAERLREMLEAIDSCPAPVVTAVQGHALGGGAGLVACSDIVVAEPGALFAFSEVKLGIVPAVISPYVLRRIGEGPARRFFLTGERFDAATALRIGLISEVADDLGAAVDRIVGEILSAGPEAVRAAKRIAIEHPDGPETVQRIAARRTSDEGQEGLRAFLERRKAGWSP